MKGSTLVWIVIIAVILFTLPEKKEDTAYGWITYDDFETGLRTDLWDFSESTELPQIHMSDYFGENVMSLREGAVAESKKEFTTDDLKFTFALCFQTCGSSPYSSPPPALYYGDIVLPIDMPIVGSGQAIDCDVHGANGILEIYRTDDLDLNKFAIDVNGIKKYEGTNFNQALLKFVGGGGQHGNCNALGLEINEVEWQPYYSCAINSTTEVVVRESFTSGSEVGLHTLTYTPTKFCPQDLGILRFTEGGLTEEVGTLTERIARGEILTIPPEDLYWMVFYITPYVAGMQEQCNQPGQAYDVPTGQCVQIAIQGIPDEVLLYCDASNPCEIPPQCPGTVECVDNMCEYDTTCSHTQIINYLIAMASIDIREPGVLLLNDGIFEVTVDASMAPPYDEVAGELVIIPDVDILSNQPGCSVAHGDYLPPNRLGCYQANVRWGSYLFDAINGETTILDDYVSVDYTLTGRGAYNDGGVYEFQDAEDSTGYFVITLKDILEIELNDYNALPNLNEDAKVSVTVTNNLFDLPDSGYKTRFNEEMLDIQGPTTSHFKPYINGTTTFDIDMDTQTVGIYTMEITPYFPLLGTSEYLVQQLVLAYYVILEGGNCQATGCPVGVCQADGSCLVTDVLDCRDAGVSCPEGFNCNQNTGLCQSIVTIDCRTPGNDCPSGFYCDGVTGNCLQEGDGDGEELFTGLFPVFILFGAFMVFMMVMRRR